MADTIIHHDCSLFQRTTLVSMGPIIGVRQHRCSYLSPAALSEYQFLSARVLLMSSSGCDREMRYENGQCRCRCRCRASQTTTVACLCRQGLQPLWARRGKASRASACACVYKAARPIISCVESHVQRGSPSVRASSRHRRGAQCSRALEGIRCCDH